MTVINRLVDKIFCSCWKGSNFYTDSKLDVIYEQALTDLRLIILDFWRLGCIQSKIAEVIYIQ